MPLLFVCIGLAAGVLSGLFGIGGGLLIVPALVFLARFSTKLALGTSLGALLLPVGALGAYTYWRNGHVDFRASLLIAAGLTVGALGGSLLAQSLPSVTLQRMFAAFLVVMALQLWWKAGVA